MADLQVIQYDYTVTVTEAGPITVDVNTQPVTQVSLLQGGPHSHPATDIRDFDAAVAANATVALNTTHRGEINKHIDWTAATQSLNTTGNITAYGINTTGNITADFNIWADGDVIASGDVMSAHDLYVNISDLGGDANIYFWDATGGDQGAWINYSTSEFTFSEKIMSNKGLTVGGALTLEEGIFSNQDNKTFQFLGDNCALTLPNGSSTLGGCIVLAYDSLYTNHSGNQTNSQIYFYYDSSNQGASVFLPKLAGSNFTFTRPLDVRGAVSINTLGGDADSYQYFYHNTSATGASIHIDKATADSEFQFSHGIDAAGDIISSGDFVVGGALTGNDVGLQVVFDGGGSAIAASTQVDLVVPYDMTVNSWTIMGDQTGSIVVDIWEDTYANFPPTVADTITGSEKPTITSSTKGQDTSLASGSGWSLTKGNILRFNVDSASTVERVTVQLQGVTA